MYCLLMHECFWAMQVHTLSSSGTRALVRVDEVNAGASILTGLRLTFIDLFRAVYTMVPRDTLPEKKNQHQNDWSSIFFKIAFCTITLINFHVFSFSPVKIHLPHNCSLPNNQYRQLHSGKDWVSTRPLVPGSNSQCSRPGIDNNECFLHPDTGLSFCTGEPLPPLKSYRKELWFMSNIKIKYCTMENSICLGVLPCCLAATSQDTLGMSQ